MIAVVTAYYRATIPLSVGRVRSIDGSHTFQLPHDQTVTPLERMNQYRLLARQRVADSYGISPLLVVVRDITTDTLSAGEAQEAP